jgi:hypothetical protein
MEEKELRNILTRFLEGKEAHSTLEEVLDGFPEKAFNAFPPNLPYTFWHLLEHIRIAQWDILEYVRNPKHVSPDWPEGYWPKKGEKADKAAWQKTIKSYNKDLRDLVKIVSDPKTDILKKMPHMDGNTIAREIMLVIDHAAYHIGEFSVLRGSMDLQ